jgi:hypothetical protein
LGFDIWNFVPLKYFQQNKSLPSLDFYYSESSRLETFAKRPFLPNPPEADKFLRLPREMRSLFLWGQAQILILKILNVFLWLKLSPSLNLNPG